MEELFRKYCKYLAEENEELNKGNPVVLLKSDFEKGDIDFYDFLNSMYQWNKVFHITANNLKNTGISNIEITDDDVIYTARRLGIRLVFNGHDRRGVPFELLNFGEYEQEELEIFDQIIDTESVLFDIGANIGWYSLNWAKQFPSCTIHAFEPISETHQLCAKNFELNHAQNIHLHQLAISDKDGPQEYFFSSEASVLASSENIMDYENAKKVSVNVETLDTFVGNNMSGAHIDLLKCDVEGGEFATVKGAVETIRRDKPIIVLELFHEWSKKFDYHPDEVLRFLEDLGYSAFLPKVGKLEPVQHYLGEGFSRQNYFFLHKTIHLDLTKRLSTNFS